MDNTVSENTEKKTIEVKQSFFSSAISDISAYIQLVDTKVSIIMAAVVAIIMGGVACYELIENLISLVKPCSWQGVALIISTTALVVSIIHQAKRRLHKDQRLACLRIREIKRSDSSNEI